MDKKKIMIIDVGREYGGAERMIESLISTLDNKFEISLIVNNKGRFKERMDNKYNINLLSIKNSLNKLPVNIIKVNKYVKDNKIEIINAHGIISGLIGVLIKKISKVKLIVTVHSDLRYDFSGIKKVIYYWIEKFVVNRCDEIITVSNNLNDKIYDRHKVRAKTIYNGLKSSNSNVEVEKKLDDKFNILFVGRLTKVKNVELLLNGLKYLNDNNVKFMCNIIGDGEEKDKLIEIAKKYKINNCVKFLGFRNDVNYFMKKSDILLITSHMEGMPMVIIEAFSNKLTVVSSNVGGVPEMIENNVNGIMFDINDKQSFFNVLVDIVEGNYDLKRIGNNAYIDYLNKWSNKVMTNAYLKLYE